MLFSDYVVWYLFLAGAGAGCYAIASCWGIVTMRGQSSESVRLPDACRLGFAASPVLLLVASLFLLVDLGSPERVWSIFLHPFDSVIAAGACLVASLALLSCVVVAVGITARGRPRSFFGLCWIGGTLLALGVMAYTGVLFSSMVSVDFWHSMLIPLLFVASSFTTGSGVIVCLDILFGGSSSEGVPTFRRIALVGSLLEACVLVVFLVDRFCFSALARLSCAMLVAGELAFPFWFGVVFLGFAMPFALHALYARLPITGFALASSAGVLVGGFCLRYCVVGAAVLPIAMLGSFL